MPNLGYGGEQERTDQAALMGAALAAVIATVVQPGTYSLYSSLTGAALAFLVLAYYRRVPVFSAWRRWFRAAAFGGVLALTATLFLAYWLQEAGLHRHWWAEECPSGPVFDRPQCVADRVTEYAMPTAFLVILVISIAVHEWSWLRDTIGRDTAGLRGSGSMRDEPVQPASSPREPGRDPETPESSATADDST